MGSKMARLWPRHIPSRLRIRWDVDDELLQCHFCGIVRASLDDRPSGPLRGPTSRGSQTKRQSNHWLCWWTDRLRMGNRDVEARYREAHREEINARKRLWHAINRERVNMVRREKYMKDGEKNWRGKVRGADVRCVQNCSIAGTWCTASIQPFTMLPM